MEEVKRLLKKRLGALKAELKIHLISSKRPRKTFGYKLLKGKIAAIKRRIHQL